MSNKSTSEFSETEAIHVASVLEDCVDELATLGRTMAVGASAKPSYAHAQIGRLLRMKHGNKKYRRMDEYLKYQSIVGKMGELDLIEEKAGRNFDKHTNHTDRHSDSQSRGDSINININNLDLLPMKSNRSLIIYSRNMTKLQNERMFVEGVLTETLAEILLHNTSHTLTDTVKAEQERKAQLQEFFLKETSGKKRVRLLQKKLQDVKKEKERGLQERNEMIAHLKDQVQQMKVKTNMESKYTKKYTEMSVGQNCQNVTQSETQLQEQIEKLKFAIQEEVVCHKEMIGFLQEQESKLESKLEYWSEKYVVDVADKQRELDDLKATRSSNLDQLGVLHYKYEDFEQFVKGYREEKKKLNDQLQIDMKELDAIIIIQAWWRGVRVRTGHGIRVYGIKKRAKRGRK